MHDVYLDLVINGIRLAIFAPFSEKSYQDGLSGLFDD